MLRSATSDLIWCRPAALASIRPGCSTSANHLREGFGPGIVVVAFGLPDCARMYERGVGRCPR
jgi:hypothetical protein